jgi:hypothetical protein
LATPNILYVNFERLNARDYVIRPYIGNFTTFLKKKQQISNKNFNRQFQIENKTGNMLLSHTVANRRGDHINICSCSDCFGFMGVLGPQRI